MPMFLLVVSIMFWKAQEDLRSSLAELSKTMEQFHSASLTMNSILDENKTDEGQ
jgi:phospholipid/cholesterol/gamma-HCH transport system substrate-binding protein